MRRAPLILILLPAVLGACARPAPEPLRAPRRVPGAEHYRPLDGLLGSPTLRHLVDLQTARDGAALAEALAHPDSLVRARAAFALGSVQDSAAVAALIPRLEDASAAVRADAAFALGQTPTDAGGRALLARALVEQDSVVLARLLDALGRAGGEEELRGLVDAELVDARDGPPAIAAALALAYARFGMRGLHDQLATDWLVAALAAPTRAVRQNAAVYFARSPDPQPWAHRRRWLVRALEDLEPRDRSAMHLLVGLSRLDDADDLDRFVEWLAGSPDWAIRTSAVHALARHADDALARAALVGALDDASHHVRAAAAVGLARAELTEREAEALTALAPAFAAEPPVYGPLLRALAAAGRTDWVLQRWLELTDPRARRSAIAALAIVPGGAAFGALEQAAGGEDAALAAAAVEALGRRRVLELEDVVDARYYAIFSDALRTRERATTYAAAQALGDSSFAAFGAGPLLQSVFLQLTAPADLEAMVAMVQALGALRDPTAVPLLREARSGAWPELRAAAAQALSRITGEPAAAPPGEPAPTRTIQWDWLAQWGTAPRLRLETERGTIVLQLSVEQAPLTVQTVLSLAVEGRYDGVPFHRVVPNFVVQGGDVEGAHGWGGPGFVIRSELTRVPFLRGTAGMASSGKDTEGSQYFVTHSIQPHLDGRYTAFATLVEGLEVLDEIREGDRVTRATALVTPEGA